MPGYPLQAVIPYAPNSAFLLGQGRSPSRTMAALALYTLVFVRELYIGTLGGPYGGGYHQATSSAVCHVKLLNHNGN